MLAHFRRRSPRLFLPALTVGALVFAAAAAFSGRAQISAIHEPHEKHLANVRQLTFAGQNAEAYFSHDGRRLTFQSQREGYDCDQQYVMGIDGSNVHRISPGTGRTTCGWWMKDEVSVAT